VTTVSGATGPAAARPDETGRARRAETTVVEPRGDGLSRRVADRWDGGAVAAWSVTTLVGWALLAAVISVLGLLVTKVLLESAAITDADEWLPEWLNDRRTPTRTDLSDIGSRIGDVPVIPALIALTAIVSLAVRRARIGVFMITAIVIELTLYRLGAWVAPRERPDVPRLDDHLPMDESFPSGHVAATTVTYMGLAMIISSWARRRWVSVVAWTIAVLAVLVVALSRMYRGMHHPLDALGGFLLGLGCLAVALLAIRVYGHVKARRERAEATS
jgi:membrane-associated phospholipid phosphatase